MKFVIKHESQSRLRIHACVGRMTLSQADIFEYYLKNTDGVMDVTVYDRTCDAVIFFTGGRDGVIKALSSFSFGSAEKTVSLSRHSARAVEREFEDRLFFTVALRLAKRFLLPAPLRAVITAVKAVKYAARGVKELLRGRITVPVLDAAAISVSVLRGDFSTASSVMFLLNIGDILDEWTREFYQEGRHRIDLVRFGQYGGDTDYLWPWKDGTYEGTSFGAYRNVFPIPATVLESNPNAIQNPGY